MITPLQARAERWPPGSHLGLWLWWEITGLVTN
jgi:hypothetical protein